MSGLVTSIYNNDIRPNACSFIVVAIGVYFVTPILLSNLGSLPGSFAVKSAALAGLYAVGSHAVCNSMSM